MKTLTPVPRISENQLTKLYYSIGEVAEMFDVNTSLIRFWEKEFTSIKPKKNKKGNRMFTPKDIVKIDQIYYLVKENGYTLDGAKKAIRTKNIPEAVSETAIDNSEVINRLEGIKAKLEALRG
jgi:DNA-binding transcriptional MerR regulator